MDADSVLELVACRLEEPNFGDLCGIISKRKRDREDADLRMRARQEQRKEIANWVRSFKSDKGNSPLRFLKSVRDGDADADQYAWGPEVAVAVLGGLVTVTLEMVMELHLANCQRRFRFTITEKGIKLLDQGGTAVEKSVKAKQAEET